MGLSAGSDSATSSRTVFAAFDDDDDLLDFDAGESVCVLFFFVEEDGGMMNEGEFRLEETKRVIVERNQFSTI